MLSIEVKREAEQILKVCDDYLDKMVKTTEDSPYHRESSVFTHTMMTVEWTYRIGNELELSKYDMAVALVVATFHDIGKPDMEETLYSENLGCNYRRYKGHEKHSARIFIDMLNKYWDKLKEFKWFKEILYNDWADEDAVYYAIPMMIQNHVPYGMNDKSLRDLYTSFNDLTLVEDITNTFMAACLGDATGRKVDNEAGKLEGAVKWIPRWENVTNMPENANFTFDQPECIVLIGPSGAGKNTYIKEMNFGERDTGIFSLDDCREEFYYQMNGEYTDYNTAFNFCNENQNEFNEFVEKTWQDMLKQNNLVIVNNTNSTKKSRKRWINTAKQKGFLVRGVVFNSASLDELKSRQKVREDKTVPAHVVEKQFYSLTLPMLDDEVDILEVQ